MSELKAAIFDLGVTLIRTERSKPFQERLLELGVSRDEDEIQKAFDFSDKVDTKVANIRKDEIMQIQQEISLELNKKLIGNSYSVIIDNYDLSKKLYMGRSYAYAPDDADGYIYISSSEKLEIGNIYTVVITDVDAYELKAKLLK